MDEMTLVRDLRSDAPRPDRSRLAAGRLDLMHAANGTGRRSRRLRTGRQLAAVGAAVVLTVAAVLGGRLWDGGGGSEGSMVGGAPPDLGSATAAEVLEYAADVVAARPAPTPHAGQWVHEVEYETNITDDEHPAQESEHWQPYADPAFENGRSGDDYSARKRYRFLDDLPDDPDAVKAKARTFYPGDDESRAQHDLRALSMLAKSYPAPPEGLAAVYRAMATLPDLKATGTTDALGRPAIALYLPAHPRKSAPSHRLPNGQSTTYPQDNQQFLISADTYTYAGTRIVAVADHSSEHLEGSDQGWKKGDVVIDVARKKITLEDDKG